jgi:hypothetical protein
MSAQGTRKSRIACNRRCHDCGKPCNNYRCEKCWAKIRNGSDYYIHPQSYHGLESMEAAYE